MISKLLKVFFFLKNNCRDDFLFFIILILVFFLFFWGLVLGVTHERFSQLKGFITGGAPP
jgi:hypothetical protein